MERTTVEFERAVSLDPEFSEAHSNLGVLYAELGRVEDAAARLQRAVELDATMSIYQSNLACVLLILGRYAEGNQAARAALAIGSANAIAHYLLGWELVRHPGKEDEAISHLEYAARWFPEAHYVLARAWTMKGSADRARHEMGLYAKKPKPPVTPRTTAGWKSGLKASNK